MQLLGLACSNPGALQLPEGLLCVPGYPYDILHDSSCKLPGTIRQPWGQLRVLVLVPK